MKTKAQNAVQPPTPAEPNRCLFADARGHQCRMLRYGKHPVLCPFHANQERHLLDPGRVANELATLSGEFKTANDVNRALGKLFVLLAADRLPVRNAAVLAYIGQLLLHSLSDVRNEIEDCQGEEAFQEAVYRALPEEAPNPK